MRYGLLSDLWFPYGYIVPQRNLIRLFNGILIISMSELWYACCVLSDSGLAIRQIIPQWSLIPSCSGPPGRQNVGFHFGTLRSEIARYVYTYRKKPCTTCTILAVAMFQDAWFVRNNYCFGNERLVIDVETKHGDSCHKVRKHNCFVNFTPFSAHNPWLPKQE